MTDLTDAVIGNGSNPVVPLPSEASGGNVGFSPRGVARFVVGGAVQVGHKRGRLLGFPTANLELAPGQVPQGVWFGCVSLEDGRSFPAAVSVGRRATFAEDTNDGILLEAHLIDVEEDLYGSFITVSLYRTIRAQRSYSRVQELIDQLNRDVESVRRWAKEPAGRNADVPGWALTRVDSAIKKQLALGRGVPDSRTLAQLTGLSRHLAKRCLAWRKEPGQSATFSGTIGSRHQRGR